MKIYAIARNYSPGEAPGHEDFDPAVLERSAMGMGPDAVWYDIPNSAIMQTGNPFFVPGFAGEFRALPTLCLRIGRLGKGIATRFAHRYIADATFACAVVATDLLRSLRSRGLPWCPAVAFDRCCMLGNFQAFDTLYINRRFDVSAGNETLVYDSSCIVHSASAIIAGISAENTLKTGDLILLALHPFGVRLLPGTRLLVTPSNQSTNLIDINIK